MKKNLLFLPFVLLLAGAFISCEEVEEVGKYDNWRERNEAFADSLKAVAGTNYVNTGEQADAMELGKLYAILVPTTGTTDGLQFIYCKKLKANAEGIRPNYTGYRSTVSAQYYGTDILGESFDGTFEGYSSLDKNIPIPPERWPNDFSTPAQFSVEYVVPGWTTVLQYMREGERWMVYIPWESGYSESGSPDGTILGYSAIVFDMIVEEVID